MVVEGSHRVKGHRFLLVPGLEQLLHLGEHALLAQGALAHGLIGGQGAAELQLQLLQGLAVLLQGAGLGLADLLDGYPKPPVEHDVGHPDHVLQGVAPVAVVPLGHGKEPLALPKPQRGGRNVQ